MMRRVVPVLVVAVAAAVAFGAYAKRRMDALERRAADQRHAIAELLGEMEWQATRLAERDVRREEMRRNAESLHCPPEIARLRAAQRKAERAGLSERMFSLARLRAAYDSVWADFDAPGEWAAPSGGGTTAQ